MIRSDGLIGWSDRMVQLDGPIGLFNRIGPETPYMGFQGLSLKLHIMVCSGSNSVSDSANAKLSIFMAF